MPLHDWFCADHGDFEGSHPICPAFGCESEDVIKVFRKAPGIISGNTRNTDRTFRSLSDSTGQTNFRTAYPGESAHVDAKPEGIRSLWGADAARQYGGVDIPRLMTQPIAPGSDAATAVLERTRGAKLRSSLQGLRKELKEGRENVDPDRYGAAARFL